MCEVIESCGTTTPHVHSVPGVDRHYECSRCGKAASDKWAPSRAMRSGFVHTGLAGSWPGCPEHPTAPRRGPCNLREVGTGLPLGGAS